MGNASQDQEQSEFANTGVAKRGSDAKIGGDLMERWRRPKTGPQVGSEVGS